MRTEEHVPLTAAHRLTGALTGTASVWSETVHAGADVEILAGIEGGPAALTRRPVGAGTAWYLATQPDAHAIDQLVELLRTATGLAPSPPPGVEVVRRRCATGSWLFAINHADTDADVGGAGRELLTDTPTDHLVVAAGAVAVLRES